MDEVQRAEDHLAAVKAELTIEQRRKVNSLFTELGFNAGKGRPCDVSFLRGFMRRDALDLRLVVFPTKEVMDRVDTILGEQGNG